MKEIMRWFKFLFYDIKYNIKSVKLRILISIGLVLGMFLLTNQTNFEKKHEDKVINFLYGVDYNETNSEKYVADLDKENNKTYIPIRWILINIVTLMVFIDFFSLDFKNRNQFIFTRIHKSKYYLIKIFTLFFVLLIFYVLLFSTLIIFNISTIINFSGEFIKVFSLYFLTSFTLMLLYNSTSLYLNYKISLSITVFSIIGVIKWNNPLLIGQHSLIARHIPYSKYQVLEYTDSLWYLTIIIFCTILLSYVCLQNTIFKEEKTCLENWKLRM